MFDEKKTALQRSFPSHFRPHVASWANQLTAFTMTLVLQFLSTSPPPHITSRTSPPAAKCLQRTKPMLYVQFGSSLLVKLKQRKDIEMLSQQNVGGLEACREQWRIKDFSDGMGASTPKVGAPIYYLAKFVLKTAWKRKKLDLEGKACPWRPLRSANGEGDAVKQSNHTLANKISIPIEMYDKLKWLKNRGDFSLQTSNCMWKKMVMWRVFNTIKSRTLNF